MGRWLRVAGCCVIGLAVASLTRELRLRAFASHRESQQYEGTYYLPSSGWLPVFSLGYRQALADLIWCKSLVYFGEELGRSRASPHVFAYTDAILALDPDFKAAYAWIATASMYRPVAPTIDVGLRAAKYLEEAVKRWPYDMELRWDYGSFLRFELAPLEPDQVRKSALLDRAAPHLARAARAGAGPPWLAISNASMLNKLGRVNQAIQALEELYPTVTDPDMQRDIEQRLLALRRQTFQEGMQAAMAKLEEERLQAYPYLSPMLFLLVGQPPSGGVRDLLSTYLEMSDAEVDAFEDAL